MNMIMDFFHLLFYFMDFYFLNEKHAILNVFNKTHEFMACFIVDKFYYLFFKLIVDKKAALINLQNVYSTVKNFMIKMIVMVAVYAALIW